MATQRRHWYKARVREDGSLVVDELQLMPGQEFMIELHEEEEESLGVLIPIAFWESHKSWLDDPEEDAAWSYLLEET